MVRVVVTLRRVSAVAAATLLGTTSLAAASAADSAEQHATATPRPSLTASPHPDASAQANLVWYVNNYRKANGVPRSAIELGLAGGCPSSCSRHGSHESP